MNKIQRPVTIFCDIDGTLVKHAPPLKSSMPNHHMELIEGTPEKLDEWDRLGYNIILTTGRRESMRLNTERQLSEVGIFYDQLIMGIGGGPRYLINDLKPDGAETAFSIQIERNKGLKNVKI
jgi:hypothetical protein|tara:strand:- start:8295 stop:8660 length:366 start_codon:yes stop_codon:yes gene_type:complete